MKELKNLLYCNHKIVDYPLTIDGTSPNYFSRLFYVSNKNTDIIEVREFTTTENIEDYTYTLDGFTNWSLSSDGAQINFNVDGLCQYGFVDGNTNIYPSQQYLVTYYTTEEDCPKCKGYGIAYDIYFDEFGNFKTVTGVDKLKQVLMKALLTILGSNEFYSSYGSEVSVLVGQKFTVYNQIKLQQSIRDTIDYLRSVQAKEDNLPLDESILRVEDIIVIQDPIEPRQINVNIKVLSGTYEEVSLGLNLRI